MWVASRVAADAQTAATPPPPHDAAPPPLTRLSVEELSRLDVSTVSRRAEAITDAAGSIAVITREDLRRAGIQTLPEAMRLATGVAAARLRGGSWAITARGFNSEIANKIAVLIDGRSVHSPLFSGVFWDVQDVVLEDVERIEVLRGPGGTLWGANAINGVINVITRAASDTQGAFVQVDVGTGHSQVVARHGGPAGGAGAYRVYVKARGTRESPLENGDDAGDAHRLGQSGMRFDWAVSSRTALTLQGDVYSGAVDMPGLTDGSVAGGNALARVQHTFDSGAQLQAQSYYDGTDRDIPQVFGERRHTFDAEVQYRRPFRGRGDLLVGGGYQVTSDRTSGSSTLRFDPASRASRLWTAYAQGSVTVIPATLTAIVGGKVERNDFSGTELQPTARLRWSFAPGDTIWAAVSRAVRTPTRFDSDLRLLDPGSGAVLLAGTTDFDGEAVTAYEVGYRSEVDFSLSFDVAAFVNDYDALRSQEPGDSFLVIGNGLNARAVGVEASLRYQPLERWQLQAGVTRQEFEFTFDDGRMNPAGGSVEHNDPRNQIWLRSYLDLPAGTEINATYRFVGELPDPRVPRDHDLTLQLALLRGRTAEVAVVGDNLLEERHVEFGATAPRVAVRRTVFGRVTWRF